MTTELVTANTDLQVKRKINFQVLLKTWNIISNILLTKVHLLMAVLGDLNTRSKGWYKNDVTSWRFKIDIATSRFCLSHIINNTLQ